MATEIAHGFGITDKDIIYIENRTKDDYMNIITKLKQEFKALGKAKKHTFLFVYAAGHGVAEQVQLMVTNAISGNLLTLEVNLRRICKASENYCTVVAIYDMCRDNTSGYKELTQQI